MKLSEKQLSEAVKTGALAQAEIVTAELYGCNYADGSADGCEIGLRTKDGRLVVLLLDTTEDEALTVRLITDQAKVQQALPDLTTTPAPAPAQPTVQQRRELAEQRRAAAGRTETA